MLVEARGRGWDVTGVEPSEFAAAYARDHFNLDVLEQDLLTRRPARGRFDAIVLGDVIEHLTDPLAALQHIATLLAPGRRPLHDAAGLRAAASRGRMGARWWASSRRTSSTSRGTRCRCCSSRAGYEVLEITTAPKTFTIRYYAWRLGGYSPALARSGRRRRSQLIGFADGLWTPDFRDRMAVVARGNVRRRWTLEAAAP